VTLQDKRLLLISTINHQSGIPHHAFRVGAKEDKHSRAVEVSPLGIDRAIYPTHSPAESSAYHTLSLAELPVCASLCEQQ
jgi:hypothetical protein